MKKRLTAMALALVLALSAAPALAAGTEAMPTNDRLTVDGVVQNPTVYKINGSNYFKIRDLAAILNGTPKQFGVGYDGATNSVTATTGEGYVKQDTDLAGPPAGGNKPAAPSNDVIYVNGARTQAEVYKIDGNNYFKLRDLGDALGFAVNWDAQRGIFIETGEPAAPVEPDQPSGATLANGKPVTEENVLAIMAEIEKEYPTGTLWATSATTGTGHNPNPVSYTVELTLGTQYHISTKYACGGFAAMVSDRIFGYDLPCRKVDDVANVRPGDIVVYLDKNGKPQHVAIAMTTIFNSDNVIDICDGNSNDQVVWSTDEEFNSTSLDNTYYTVYTRYPEG